MVKYFPLDKNYILKEAQLSSKAALRKTLFQEIKKAYFDFFNPLKLEDKLTCQIQNCQKPRWKNLDEFYNYLAAIYRFKFGENQLEFQFDGKTHHQKYCEEWGNIFQEWAQDLCRDSFFVKAVLELLIFQDKGRRVDLTEMRLKSVLASHFQVRIHKSRGILEREVA